MSTTYQAVHGLPSVKLYGDNAGEKQEDAWRDQVVQLIDSIIEFNRLYQPFGNEVALKRIAKIHQPTKL